MKQEGDAAWHPLICICAIPFALHLPFDSAQRVSVLRITDKSSNFVEYVVA